MILYTDLLFNQLNYYIKIIYLPNEYSKEMGLGIIR